MQSSNSVKRVGIKFCGHCSPRRDMQRLAGELKERKRDCEFVYWSQNTNVDVLLILNACEAGCAKQPAFVGSIIHVTPETVDYWQVEAKELCNTVIKKLEEILDKSP